jgi:hypothetical protein
MPIGQKPVLLTRQTEQAARLVEHDKVVAGALHFGKLNPHQRIIGSGPAARNPHWLTMQGSTGCCTPGPLV